MSHPRILVAFDFGPLGEPLLAWAAGLAKRLGGSLSIIHVMPTPAWVIEPAATPMYPAPDEVNKVRDEIQSIAERQSVVAPIEVVVGVHVGETLVTSAAAQHADFIALGTHGRGVIRRAFLGSVAEFVVRHAGCPVITMRSVPPS